MSTKNFPLIFFVGLIIISQLACNFGASQATPDPFATLNGLYTAAARTLEAGGTPAASTSTPGLPQPTAGGTSAAATVLPASQTPGSRFPM